MELIIKGTEQEIQKILSTIVSSQEVNGLDTVIHCDGHLVGQTSLVQKEVHRSKRYKF